MESQYRKQVLTWYTDVCNLIFITQNMPIVKTSGGTEVQDIVQGLGKIAKPGRKVRVNWLRYECKASVCRCL